MIDPGREIQQRDDRDQPAKQRRSAEVTESTRVRCPVAQCRAQGLRKGDRQPVKQLRPTTDNVCRRHLAFDRLPGRQRTQHQRQEQGRAAGIADAQGAVGIVRQGRARSRRCDDGRPVKPRTIALCPDLQPHEQGQGQAEYQGPDEVAVDWADRRRGCGFPKPTHADRVAAGFAKRRREYFGDPETKRNGRNLAEVVPCRFVHRSSFGRD